MDPVLGQRSVEQQGSSISSVAAAVADRAPPTAGRPWRFLSAAVVLAGVLCAGLIGGWTAASQKSAGGAHVEEEGQGPHGGGLTLSSRALSNLGVEVGPIALSEFVRTVDIPAVVESLPLAERPVTSPVAGTVRKVFVRPGGTVAADALIAEVVREPYAPPSLLITDGVLRPLNEEYHKASAEVRTSALALELARAERERLAPAGSDGADRVTGRVVREAQYAVQRAERELDNAREEAQRHGLTPEQIVELEKGNEESIPDLPDVRRVLMRNRLWSAEADAVLALLPERARILPHTLAVLGELVGTGRLTAELAEVMRAEPRLGAVFLDVAGLVQTGATPTALADLAARGAFEPVVALRAPSDGAATWDVLDLDLRAGAHVEAGQRVASLRDDRVMALRLTPAPSDLPPLTEALTAGAPLRAEPLVRDAGATLDDVQLLSLTGASAGHGLGALATVTNRVLAERSAGGAGAYRTWAVRPGLSYVVKVPIERKPGRFVLPADAIAYQGPEAVVLLPDGKGFRTVPVRLEHHDAQVAVVAADGALFPGDQVVLKGAPALAIALLAGAGGADPHAGHNH